MQKKEVQLLEDECPPNLEGSQTEIRPKAARLSKKNIEDREAFYEAEKHRTKREWQPVTYTDSTKFELQHDASKRNDGSYMPEGVDPPAATKNKHCDWIYLYAGVNRGLVGPYWVPAGESINAKLYSEEMLPVMIADLDAQMEELDEGYPYHLQQDLHEKNMSYR